ncbi:MAG: hypothetical protein HY741_28540 [Chloroflexi bacterium]|nr:hypothetical protein [Chloroflexota bacterium]
MKTKTRPANARTRGKITTALAQLQRAELVRQISEHDADYSFKHTLVQDTVNASLLKNDLKRLHRLIGETLERTYPERLDENAVRLAQHFWAAGEDAKCYGYSFRAGEIAMGVHALDEALEHFTRALTLASRANVSPEAAYLKRGRVLELLGRFEDAAAHYRAMHAAGVAQDNRALALAALSAKATIHAIPSVLHDAARAKQLSAEALALARALDNPAAEAKILWNLMLVGTRVDTAYREGIAFGEQSLAIARAHDLREQIAYDLKDLAPL